MASCSAFFAHEKPDRNNRCSVGPLVVDGLVTAAATVLVLSAWLDTRSCQGGVGERCGDGAAFIGVPAAIIGTPFAFSTLYGALTLPQCLRASRP